MLYLYSFFFLFWTSGVFLLSIDVSGLIIFVFFFFTVLSLGGVYWSDFVELGETIFVFCILFFVNSMTRI